jgi:hypothetical protein
MKHPWQGLIDTKKDNYPMDVSSVPLKNKELEI